MHRVSLFLLRGISLFVRNKNSHNLFGQDKMRTKHGFVVTRMSGNVRIVAG